MKEQLDELCLQFRANTLALAELFIQQVKQAGANSPQLYILPHHRADGDAIGSSFALKLVLDKLGWQSEVVMAEAIPEMYTYLKLPAYTVCQDETQAKKLAEKLHKETAYVCLIDNSDPESRLGMRFALWQACSDDRRLIIDHHVSKLVAGAKNKGHFDIAAEQIACAGMVTELLLLLEDKCQQKLIDKQIASCLMTGIVTDSGQLSYSATSSQTYLLMAILKNRGADQELINRLHYHTMSLAKMQMIALSFSQTDFYFAKRCLLATLSAEQIANAHAEEVDIDGISSMLREVQGVDVAVLLRSTMKGNVLGSIRSSEKVNCQQIAARLGGGGHERASGFTLYGLDLPTAKKQFIAACQPELGSENAE